jgi:macrodomain Ter protein organizer (MatP/YcbG family)
MPRTPPGITGENVAAAYRYLLTALASPKRGIRFITGPDKRDQAIGTLRELSVDADQFLQGSDRFAPKPQALQNWIKKSLDGNATKRMWTALRQQEYKARHKVRRIGIKEKLYYRLTAYADHKGLTLEEALDRLLQGVDY